MASVSTSQPPTTSTQSTSTHDQKMTTTAALALDIPNHSLSADPAERPLLDIISERFPPFDSALIVAPFDEETANCAKIEEELCNMLLSTLLKTHAWMSSRPKHEAAAASRKLESEISNIMARERKQGMSAPSPSSLSPSSSTLSLPPSYMRRGGLMEQTRERLGQFVERMKTALSALLDTSF